MTSISVVIPTFNRASLIGETLARVLGQTVPASEIIVVDDGSTDDTSSILGSYGAKVRVIRQENSGDLVARNNGSRAAAGELVAFCDSDDLWEPEFLAVMAAQWQGEPEMLACYSDFRLLEGNTASSRTKFDEAPAGYWSGMRKTDQGAEVFDEPTVERLLRFQPFFPSCMMVARRPFLEAGGWDEGVSRILGCDFATALRLAARPPMGVVRRPLVCIRKHQGNISGNTERMNLGDARVLEHVLLTRPELASLRDDIERSIISRRRDALDSAFSRSDFMAVREIGRLLPRSRLSIRQQIKAMIATLPSPFITLATAVLARRSDPVVGR